MIEIGIGPAERIADEILSRRQIKLARRISANPRNYPYLSDIGECNRQMAYGVLNWNQRTLWDEGLQARFEAGNIQETAIVRELQELGFEITLSQMPVEIKGNGGVLLARGKIDGFIGFDGVKLPFEIKSKHPSIFNSINSIDDFRKRPDLRKNLRQLQLYLFGNNVDQGIFIVTDCLGHWKLFPLYLDLGECEWLLQRLEEVYKHTQSGTLPDKIPYDASVCGKCPFSHICLPDVTNKGSMLIDNEVLEADLERHEYLKPLADEYDALHDKMKQTFSATDEAIVGGHFMIKNVVSQRTVYEIPPEIGEEISALKKAHGSKVNVKRLIIEDLTAKQKTEC